VWISFWLAFVFTVLAVRELRAQKPTPTPSATAASRLSNISTRAFVQTGDNVMIGGFIVQGTEPKRIIIAPLALSSLNMGCLIFWPIQRWNCTMAPES
jgi:uncharacterized membrane protein